MENGIPLHPTNQLLIKHISDAVIITDAQFVITDCNAAAEELFGYKEYELQGRDIALLLPSPTSHPGILSVKSTGFTQGIVEQLTHKGNSIYVYASLHAINAPQSPQAFLIIFRPIEENRHTTSIRNNPDSATLQQSEEKYRLLLEQVQAGIFIVDQNGMFAYVNARGSEMSGYSREELLQLNFLILSPPDRLAREIEKFNSIRNGPILYEECQLLRKEGIIMHVEMSAQFTADGSIMVICHDITQRKITEIALQESEEKYRQLIEHTSDAVLIFSKEYECLDANTSASDMTGYSREELIGMNLLKFIDPDDLRNTPPHTTEVLSGDKIVTIRKMRRKDGMVFYGESVVQMMPDGRIASFLRDVTQRRRNELALQQSAETYRMLFQQSPLPMFVIDLQTLQIIGVNDAAISFYGYSKNEFISLTAFDIRPPEDHAQYFEEVSSMREGTIKTGICRHIKRDGAVVNMEIYSHHFMYEDKSYRLVLAIDITEKQKAAAELLNTTTQLRDLSDHLQTIRENERTKISREIHDELGQQLTILKMDIAWLNQKLKSYNNPDLLERTEEALGMLNDTIKTVRRIATELRPSLLDDLGLIAAMDWQSKEFENRSGIIIAFSCNVSSLPIENTVATSLFRIYQEALTNVARHAQASHVTCSLIVNNDQLVLSIKDNGKGFDMQTTDNKRTLGLLGMKERTHMMGGHFEIKSAVGEGATITVWTTIR